MNTPPVTETMREEIEAAAWLLVRNRYGPGHADEAKAKNNVFWKNAIRDVRGIAALLHSTPVAGGEGSDVAVEGSTPVASPTPETKYMGEAMFNAAVGMFVNQARAWSEADYEDNSQETIAENAAYYMWHVFGSPSGIDAGIDGAPREGLTRYLRNRLRIAKAMRVNPAFTSEEKEWAKEITELEGYLALLTDGIDAGFKSPPREGWATIDSAPKDGTYVLIARDMGSPWGWVRGVGYYADIKGIAGWIALVGASEVPGVLGLAHPTHWTPFPKVERADLLSDGSCSRMSDALERIKAGQTLVHDEELEEAVVVAMDAEEMQAIATAALADGSYSQDGLDRDEHKEASSDVAEDRSTPAQEGAPERAP